MEQQRHLSLVALELLTDVILSATGNSIFGMRLVPHVMANFAVVSGINPASATIDKEMLESVAVIGDLLRGLGRWLDEYELRALHFRKMCEAAGAEHPETLASMTDLAEVPSDQGEYEQAEGMHRQTFGLRKALLGKEHPDPLRSMNNLVLVLSDQGKYEHADEMRRQALKL
jgi:hypothetical protein